MSSKKQKYLTQRFYEDALVFAVRAIDRYGLTDFLQSRASHVLEIRARAYLKENPEIFDGLMRELQIVLSEH